MNSPIKTSAACLFLLLLSACGKAPHKDGKNSNFGITESVMPDGSNVSGAYTVKLWPVNQNLQLPEVGSVILERKDDTFSVKVEFTNGSKSAWHKQGVYTGIRCPNISDDLNGDAYIDYEEALSSIGQMIIPFDNDLDAQDEGANRYPIGDDELGAYTYERSASFSKMFADLKAEDQDPNDNIIKLSASEGLGLEGKIVMIQGVSSDIFLPNSVSSPYGTTSNKSLPIACGIIYKNFDTNTDTDDGTHSTSTTSEEPTDGPHPVPTPDGTGTTDDGGVVVPPTPSEENHGWLNRLRDWFRNRF